MADNTYTQRLITQVQADPLGKSTYDMAISMGMRPAEAAKAAYDAMMQNAISTATVTGGAIKDIGTAASSASTAIAGGDLAGAETILKNATASATGTAVSLGLIAPTGGTTSSVPTGTERYVVGTAEVNGQVVQIWSDGTTTPLGMSDTAKALEAEKLANAALIKKQQTSAKAGLESWLKTFFDSSRDADTIKQLMSFIDQQVTADIPSEAIMINIRQQPFYQARFKGNEGLRAAGLAEMTPEEYLTAERLYSDVLVSANLNNLARRDVFASLIGGQVSATELQDRVVNVYGRIKNADQALQDEMKRLNQLGNITAADYAEALLTGKEGAASLKRKIAQAEISTEFTTRGIGSALGIEELANLGVSRQQAQQGAEYAKTGTKRLQDLAAIYGVQSAEIQKELESEAFKGLESQRRKQLTGRERAAFSGSSGAGSPSLGGQTVGIF